MADAPGATARPSHSIGGTVLAVLALLTAVAPLATDIYLPAFPVMATELDAGATEIQLTLTAFLLGLGIGQLFLGALSDAVGRRRPILVGSLVCLLASIACACAPNVEWLTAARFVQGLSGAAGVVLARAIVSDTSRGAAAAKLQGLMIIISVVAPVVAPLAGGMIIVGIGWRAVFWVLAGLTLLMFLGALRFVRETLPEPARTRGGVTAMIGGARKVLANRAYVGYLLTFCFAFTALFAYISASPFVVQNVMGMSTNTYTLVFSLNALVILITSSVASALAGRMRYRRMIAIGLAVASAATVGLLVSVLNGVPAVPTLVLFAVFQGSLGFVFANATAMALAEAGAHAGTGSAFLGFLQFALAAAVSPLVGIMGEHTAMPMAVAMIVSIVLAVLAFGLVPRRPEADSVADRESAVAQSG